MVQDTNRGEGLEQIARQRSGLPKTGLCKKGGIKAKDTGAETDRGGACGIDDEGFGGSFEFLSETDGRRLGRSFGEARDATNTPA